MHKFVENEEIPLPYEEELNGYTIFIDVNPDRWRGGFIWSVCKDDVELDSGIEFRGGTARLQAYNVLSSLVF